MEIIIGSIPAPRQSNQRVQKGNSNTIPAELLHVRPPRKGIAGPSGRERRIKKANDPMRGRVLTIMVPDGAQLPTDIDSGNYEVSLRLVRK